MFINLLLANVRAGRSTELSCGLEPCVQKRHHPRTHLAAPHDKFYCHSPLCLGVTYFKAEQWLYRS